MILNAQSNSIPDILVSLAASAADDNICYFAAVGLSVD